MTLVEFFQALTWISGVLFVVTSMRALGLSLIMAQIIHPLKNLRLMPLLA